MILRSNINTDKYDIVLNTNDNKVYICIKMDDMPEEIKEDAEQIKDFLINKFQGYAIIRASVKFSDGEVISQDIELTNDEGEYVFVDNEYISPILETNYYVVKEIGEKLLQEDVTATDSYAKYFTRYEIVNAIRFTVYDEVDTFAGDMLYGADMTSANNDTESQNTASVSFTRLGTRNLRYSLNGKTWEDWNGEEISFSKGTTLYIQGKNINGFNSQSTLLNSFSIRGKVNCNGNIMHLIDYEHEVNEIPNDYCFQSLFLNCEGLMSAPYLTATVLKDFCYMNMFSGCASLSAAPKLVSEDLRQGCYYEMFMNCTSLETAPDLPAQTLRIACYKGMFKGCTNITESPELWAQTLSPGCYVEMFKGCSKMSKVLIFANKPENTTDEDIYLEGWLDGVSGTGQFVKNENTTWTIPSGWIECIKDDRPNDAIKFSSEGDFSIQLKKVSNVSDINIQYSTNGLYWVKYDITNGETINGTTIYFRGVNNETVANSLYRYYNFNITDTDTKVSCEGNIMKLLDFTKNLTTIPTTYCFNGLFKGCENLISAPELPAIELEEGCYYLMFLGCTSLEKSPVLPAEKLVERCYKEMFSGCTSLKEITALCIDKINNSTYYPTDDWVSGVNADGNFIQNINAVIWDAKTSSNGIPTGWNKCVRNELLENEVLGFKAIDNDVTFKMDSFSAKRNILYKVAGTYDNKLLWDIYSLKDHNNINIPSGLTLYMYGNLDYLNNSSDYHSFQFSGGNVESQGSIMALLNGKSEVSEYCFKLLFKNCENLISAPELPAKTLAKGCYELMFLGCKKLIAAPELPAKTLADGCYKLMFYGCENLITASELLAETLADGCCELMFSGCKKLIAAPSLPATVLAEKCYDSMFYQCESLKNSPVLPAETLVNSCYQNMFNGCKSLSTVTALCKSNLSGSKTGDSLYQFLTGVAFYGEIYISLDANWGNIIPTGWQKFYYLDIQQNKTMKFTVTEDKETKISLTNSDDVNVFYSRTCEKNTWYPLTTDITLQKDGMLYLIGKNTSLNGCTFNITGGQVECTGEATRLLDYNNDDSSTIQVKEYCFKLLFKDCTNLISAPKLSATVLKEGCYESMFSGCTNLISAPELPATELAKGCYKEMFSGCTNLISAPELSAETLAEGCYETMFYGCTNLISAPELSAETLTKGCYKLMFYGCTSLEKAPELPAIELADGCYKLMFYGCEKLITAPDLSATELKEGCYELMFLGCTSLKKSPVLPAETLVNSCYQNMFNGCSSLSTVTALCKSSNLSASSSGDPLYQFLKGITTSEGKIYISLEANWGNNIIPTGWQKFYYLNIAPEKTMKFTAIDDQGSTISLTHSDNVNVFYSLTCEENTWRSLSTDITLQKDGTLYLIGNNIKFSGEVTLSTFNITGGQVECTGEATRLLDYNNDDSSTIQVPKYCFKYLFKNCTNLISAPELPAKTLADGCYEYMFYGCKNLISAPKLPAETLAEECYEEMFYGCEKLKPAPELPATELAKGCYKEMFSGCTSLEKTPVLPAKTLVDKCYDYMFYGCKSLKEATILCGVKDYFSGFDYMDNCLPRIYSGTNGTLYISSEIEPADVTDYFDGWTVEKYQNN